MFSRHFSFLVERLTDGKAQLEYQGQTLLKVGLGQYVRRARMPSPLEYRAQSCQ
jgi:hypothetical protein